MTRLLAISIAAVLLVAGGSARQAQASPSKEQLAEAERLLREGNAHYAARRYDEAIASYRRAHELTGAPGFLFNIAQVHRVAGQCREAIDHYERFLAAEPKTPLRPKVERFLDELWRCVEARRKQEDQQAAATPPVTAPPTSATGADPPPASAPPPVDGPATASGRGARPWRWVGLGAAAVGLATVGTGVYFGLEARAAADDTEGVTGEWQAEHEQREQAAARDERRAILLIAAGSAIVAGGALLFFLARGGDEEAAPVALLPTDGGAALVWAGGF